MNVQDAVSNNCFIKGAASNTYTPVAFDVNDILVAVALRTLTAASETYWAMPRTFPMMVTVHNQVLADGAQQGASVFPDQED